MSERSAVAVSEWDDPQRVAGWRRWHAKFSIQSRAATEAMVRAVEVWPGMRVLDIACGTGEPALALAEAVAPGGSVTATDAVDGMIEAARENAARAHMDNITFEHATAGALPFEDESFDAVTCRFGVMFFSDLPGALADARRVLKSGGRAGFMAWGPREQNPTWTSTYGVLAKYVALPEPEPGAPDGFRFAQSGSLAAELRAAGFEDVREDPLNLPWPWPGPAEEAWLALRELRGSDMRKVLGQIPRDRLPQAIWEAYQAMSAFSDGRSVNFTAALILTTGVK